MTPNPYRRPKNIRRVLVTGGLAAGTMLGAAGIASAATSSSTTATAGSSSTATTPPTGTPPTGTPPAGAPQGNPASMTHGPGETLLTGTQLQQATAAAAAAVPGATVIRAETNSSGGYPFEVHLSKSDGTDVTVELDTNFKVITTISGFGAGPAGSQAPSGTAPSGSPSNSAPTTTN